MMRREAFIRDGVGVVPLTMGYEALVDLADLPAVAAYLWCARKTKGGHIYAGRGFEVHGKTQIVMMHRQIMGAATREIEVDHEDHDTLNNRRKNLRLATKAQNQMNASKRRGCTSRYKGVSFNKLRGRWYAKVARRCVGSFESEAEAALAYNAVASRMFGEFALLNEVA